MLGEERRKSMEGLEKGWRDGKRTRAETKQGDGKEAKGGYSHVARGRRVRSSLRNVI